MSAMTSRDQYCPIYRSLDLFGDRWSLLVVREILRGVTRFNDLERSLPGISRSTLAQRLRHLEKEGIVVRRTANGRGAQYELTDRGRDLGAVLESVGNWGLRWLVPDIRLSDVDPDGLMLWIARHVMLGELPPQRVVIRFDVTGRKKRHFWLVLRTGEASLCPEHPGFPEDIFITATVTDLYRLMVGRTSLQQAIADGSVSIEGPPPMVRSLPRWFHLRASGPALASVDS